MRGDPNSRFGRDRAKACLVWEANYIADALEANRGSVTETARFLGIGRWYTHALIKKHNLITAAGRERSL